MLTVADALQTFVISLTDAETRRRRMTTQLNQLKIPFEFIDAVDARLGLPSPEQEGVPYDLADASGWYGRALSTTEVACFMSHRRALVRAKESAAEYTCIFEDDAMIDREIVDLLAALPRLDFDVLKIEGSIERHRASVTVGNIGRWSIRVVDKFSYGSAGYIVSRSAADQILRLPTKADAAFDDWLFYYPLRRLRAFEIEPFPVRSDISTTTMFNRPNSWRPPTGHWFRFVSRWKDGLRRRRAFVSIYGFGVYLRVEIKARSLRRHTHNTARASITSQ